MAKKKTSLPFESVFPDSIIPEQFRSNEEFMDNLREWHADREERKDPISERAGRMQMKKFSRCSVEAGIIAIENAIASGWTNVYPESVRLDLAKKNYNVKEAKKVVSIGLLVTSTISAIEKYVNDVAESERLTNKVYALAAANDPLGIEKIAADVISEKALFNTNIFKNN